jgi:hypothetical protein
MNAPFAPSLLSGVELAPRDPILGVTETELRRSDGRLVGKTTQTQSVAMPVPL